MIEIINQPNVGDWLIKTETTETLAKNVATDIVLKESTSVLLINAKLSGVAQLILETKTDRQVFEINLVKIVLPQSLADEMNLTLQMSNLSFNVDASPAWIKITDIFNLDFLDNFRDLKQDGKRSKNDQMMKKEMPFLFQLMKYSTNFLTQTKNKFNRKCFKENCPIFNPNLDYA